MCCRLPVISSDRGALPEVVGDAALLVPSMDIRKISAAMERMISNERLRAGLAKKGLARSKKFSWKKCAEDTLRVYRIALQKYNYGK